MLKIANTRGTEYGNDGYMWVSYDTLNIISSVYKNSAIDLGFEHREPSLCDITYVTVTPNKSASPVTLEFEATTSSAKGLSVVITAFDKKDSNQLHVYTVAPFKRSVEIGLGEKGFDGSTNETTGSFSIAVDNLFKDIKEQDVDNYDWYIKIANMNSNKPIKYSNLKLVSKNQSVLYKSTTDEYDITSETYVKLEKVS